MPPSKSQSSAGKSAPSPEPGKAAAYRQLPGDLSDQTLQQRVLRRLFSMESERSAWYPNWQDLSDHVLPRRGRFLQATRFNDKDRGHRLSHKILDNTATIAHRTLAAGMMSGLTSPARPWFRVGAGTVQGQQSQASKRWLNEVTKTLLEIMSKSNFYNSFHACYEELGLFGTAPLLILEDKETVIRCQTYTAGEYSSAAGGDGTVQSLYRRWAMTVEQLISFFGYENVGYQVQRDYKRNKLDWSYEVVHAIEPRVTGVPGSPFGKSMAWGSVYLLYGSGAQGMGAGDVAQLVLRESGFNEQPFACPRWAILGGDSYGRSPAMDAIGDIRQLQHEQMKKARAIDKHVDPPMVAHSSLESKRLSLLPGKVTYVDTAALQYGFRPAFQVNLNLQHLSMDIAETRLRIKEAFYEPLFKAMLGSDRRQMTAREVQERHEEKLIMLGPVLERLHNELLDPVIKRVFAIANRRGLIPDPPSDMRNGFQVEYISILAQAQKAVGTGAMQDFAGFVGGLAELNPSSVKKLDFNEMIDEYAHMTGQPPKTVRPNSEVKKELEAEKAQAQAQQMLEQAPNAKAGAEAAQTMSEIPNAGDNMLQRLMGGTVGPPQ